MYKNLIAVPRLMFGRGCFSQLDEVLAPRRAGGSVVFLLDDVFRGKPLQQRIPLHSGDSLTWVNVDDEPKTTYVDELVDGIRRAGDELPAGIVGIGGGSTMDLAKAVALMLTNPGSSSEYQGWDLVKKPGVYHVGVPTLSGTGAEVSRTTVLTGPAKKLGLNSDFTPFDQVILDPELIRDAPDPQRFYTGMDCYIHCIESLQGTYLNAFSKAYGEKALELCREVFLGDGADAEADEQLMIASYLGGMSITYSQVGACHALSYGLSYLLGVHHGVGNCVVFDTLEEFYPEGVAEFRRMIEKNRIELPRNLTRDVDEAGMNKMIEVALGMTPLWENCLGTDWRHKVGPDRLRELYLRM